MEQRISPSGLPKQHLILQSETQKGFNTHVARRLMQSAGEQIGEPYYLYKAVSQTHKPSCGNILARDDPASQ